MMGCSTTENQEKMSNLLTIKPVTFLRYQMISYIQYSKVMPQQKVCERLIFTKGDPKNTTTVHDFPFYTWSQPLKTTKTRRNSSKNKHGFFISDSHFFRKTERNDRRIFSNGESMEICNIIKNP